MFVRIVSGLIAAGAVAFAALVFVAGNMSDAPSRQLDWTDYLTPGIVFVIGVCGVIWGGK